MTFYQELQLSSAGSKQLIKNTTDKKEKRRHILIYNFKVYLVMTFCFALVTLYSMIFGSDNSVAGVVFLLALLVLRQADFGIRTHHGLLCIVGIFAILIVGPRVSNMVSPWAAFVINIGCIFTGVKDGKEKTYYIYNVCDHQECYHEVGSQAISYTTGVPAMCGALMMLTGKWIRPGVYTVEEFDPDPFLEALDKYGLPRSESHDPKLVD